MKIISILICFILLLNGFVIATSSDKDSSTLYLESKKNETDYWAVVVSTFNETHIYDALTSLNNWDISHIKFLYKENATKENILNAAFNILEPAYKQASVCIISGKERLLNANKSMDFLDLDIEEL